MDRLPGSVAAGYESDRWRLMLYDRGAAKPEPDGEFRPQCKFSGMVGRQQTIYFQSEDKPRCRSTPSPQAPGVRPQSSWAIVSTPTSISAATATRSRSRAPTSRCPRNLHREFRRNRRPQPDSPERRAALTTRPSACGLLWFEGAKKHRSKVCCFAPPQFDPSKKYPLLLLIHGGPQGEWMTIGLSLEPGVMAAAGYVVLMINPRGSFGTATNSPNRSAGIGAAKSMKT